MIRPLQWAFGQSKRGQPKTLTTGREKQKEARQEVFEKEVSWRQRNKEEERLRGERSFLA
ncbi:hypothetical protein KAM385_06240 [Aeromonas hydrophila]|nr:hypothetical protein KAM385_06240 [Aeromonas hydrophila]